MGIPFQITVIATIIGVAWGAISGQESASAQIQDYNPGQFRAALFLEGSNNPVGIYTPQEFIAVLYGLGYNVELDSQLTEPRTQQAIREFQQHYNLAVDGIAGFQTQNLAGDIVRILQYNLNLVVRPDPPLPQSYYYGSQTLAAVRRFQQIFNLPITGIASLEVRTKLNLAAQRISP